MRVGPWEAGFGLSLASTRPISWSGAHALMSPCKATSEPSSSLTCSLLRPVLLWVTLEAHWLPGPVRLEEIPFVESRRGGRWRGEQLPPYFLAFPTSCHLPAVPRKSLLGTRHGDPVYLVGHLCQGARAGPGLCLRPPGPFLPSFSLRFPSAYTFGSAWDPGTPEAPQEALREEPG